VRASSTAWPRSSPAATRASAAPSREGADVAIVYLPVEEPDAQTTKAGVEAEGRRALLVPGDVQESGFCVEVVERTLDAFGRLDIVVNNAAYQQHRKSIEDITDEQLDRTFRTNIYGYFGADTPMKRPAQPEEIAPAFVFFASNADSSYITGEVLTLLGGETTAA
jgi:NAD(P)-dependent dehydrogenase (short-subunit alcohol dehydrogenase family)